VADPNLATDTIKQFEMVLSETTIRYLALTGHGRTNAPMTQPSTPPL
jgi:hypothetical protein